MATKRATTGASPGGGGRRRGQFVRSVLAAVVMLAGACSDSDEDDEAGDRGDEGPADEPVVPQALSEDAADFYVVPDPIPAGGHGDLLRYQSVAGPPDGVTWYRVMYLSETLEGDPTVVTGVVTVPDGEAPDAGWPLVTHAHGSTGLADPCAPSVSLDGDHVAAVEIALLSSYAPSRGYVVASTDYEGLGGPGRHPFLVGQSEGRSVLDIAIAARQIPGIDVGQSTAIAGYSQGGHAALWANQIAPDWAPDLGIVGTMAGAPASELATLGEGLPTELQEASTMMILAGFAAAYPDTDLAGILTPAGLGLVDQLDAVCPDAADLTSDVPLLRADPARTEPWASLLDENTPGATESPAPVLVVHSAVDQNVPIDGSAMLLDRQCAAGQMVERRILREGDHIAAAVPAYEQAFDWFDALSRGTAPVSSCG